ncbi:alanine racemase C-terminal domain-containing protein [Gryllotalpicola sp.]|uniref:alanine racemase C-terminal domain-containing protein n=1 Tax=Gryllotalpicola sp. TaxID=1932787 RepID=UPI002611586A|nr:alanine racemase C-terminal domain-containing protein [Gryllotalpicola sp.]
MHRVARLSESALLRNLAALRDEVGPELVLDVRADAYGHGLDRVVELALGAGVHRFWPGIGVAVPRGTASIGADWRSLALYGFRQGSTPVLTLEAEVVSVKSAGSGAPVSYGYTYRTAAPTRLALVALGYADGVPRRASNTANAALGGAQHVIAGRIAMDQLVLDIHDTEAEIGSVAALWGDPAAGAPSPLDWARWTARTPAALTAALGPRIRREWVA